MATSKTNWGVIAVVAALCSLTTLSRFAASFFTSERLWGLSHLGYFPLNVRVGVTLVALAILLPWVNCHVRTWLKVILNWVDNYLFRSPFGYIPLLVGAWVVFFSFRQKSYYLGDGWLVLSNLESGRFTPGSSEPLSAWISVGLHRLLSHWHLTPESTYTLLSCSAGVLYFSLALLWSRSVATKDPLGRWFALGILMTMGVVQQFFGYVENYSLLLVAQLSYFLCGLWALEDRCSLIYPLLIFEILVLMHLSSLMLLPTLILLFAEKGKILSKASKIWVSALGIIGTAMLIIMATFEMGKLGAFSRFILPLRGGPVDAPGYNLLSWEHLADYLNLHLIASPLLFPLLFIALWSWRQVRTEEKYVRYLLLAALTQVTFSFLFNPELGAGRDWDLLAANGTLSLTLLLTYIVARTPMPGRNYLGLGLILTGLFSTGSFVALNSMKEASLRRAQDLAVLDPLRDRGYRISSLLSDLHQKSPQNFAKEVFVQKSLIRLETIIERDPENSHAHFLKGVLLRFLQREDVASAQKEFLMAIKKDLNFSFAWDGLGETYVAQGRLKEAIFCYNQHVALNPEHTQTWWKLSNLYAGTGQLDQAVQCLEKTLQLTPKSPDVWIELGRILYLKNNFSEAERAYRMGIGLNPNDAQAHFQLSSVMFNQENYKEAEAECKEAIRLSPKLTDAYNNLGAILTTMGRYDEAEKTIREGLKIDPNLPGLHYNLSQALQGQGKGGEAQKEYSIYKRLIGEEKEKEKAPPKKP